ncbi:DUF1934 family protein [Bacillus lacus]|uniref:DUF1934 family protein n=1 Tax=Metabacillus lacus TaxID=1983721 RepID=A0A7X2IWS7_9BACI|nr:DUF1934 family protein [Metabacillus lacus]
MKNSSPVQIHVHSVIKSGETEEIIEFKTTGEYYQKESSSYLSYKEEHDFGNVSTVVKMNEEEVFIMRSEALRMRQRFIPNEDTITDYKTPIGQLQLTTRTLGLAYDHSIKPLQGRLKLTYELEIGEAEKHLHTLTISYKEEE